MIKQQITKVKNILRYFRLKPFDITSTVGEEAERHRRIAVSAVSGGASQFINYIVMIIMVPLLLNYLGKEQYGLWLTISSMASFAVFSDLGLGNGLINVLSKANGLNNRIMAKQAVSSAYVAMIAISAIILIVGTPIVVSVDWNKFFKITDQSTAALTQNAILIYFILFVVNIVLSLIVKIRMAYQEAYINNLFLAITKVLMLAGCIIGKVLEFDLIYFVVVLSGAQCLTGLTNTILLMQKSRPWLLPKTKYINKNTSITLLKTGMFFYVTGISAVIATQIDSLVIARFLGAETVPAYSIPLKLFMLVNVLITFLLMPIWPAYREALTKKQLGWVKKTLFRTVLFSITINIIPITILIFFTHKIIEIWTGDTLDIPLSLILALSMSVILLAILNPLAMLLNGANIYLKQRAFIAIFRSILNLTISIFLVNKIGISGPVWGTVICQGVISLPISIYFITKVFRGHYEGMKNAS